MTDRTTKKIFGLLLLSSIVLISGFRLLSLVKRVELPADKNTQPDKRMAGIRESSTKSIGETGSQSESKPLGVLPERGDEAVNSAPTPTDVCDELRDLAKKDPESVLVWGQHQANETERKEALTDACFQIAQTDPKRALTLAENFQLNNDAVLNNIAQQWAAKDLTTAYNWIIHQPAGDQRDALLTGMTFVWSEIEPASAAQLILQQMQPGPSQDEAVMMVLHQWALVDPSSAGSWVQQFPESLLRHRALNELAGLAQYKQNLAQSK